MVEKDDDQYDETFMVERTNKKLVIQAKFEELRINICRHSNILKCYGKTQSKGGKQFLLLEHAPLGDIEAFYEKISSLEHLIIYE